MGGRTGFMGMLDRALDLGISARRNFLVNDLDGKRVTTPVPIIAAATQIAAGSTGGPPAVWVNGNIGPEISVDGFTRLTAWLNFTRTDATGVRFRLLARHTSGGTDYTLPIYNPVVLAVPYVINVDNESVVLAQDLSYVIALTWDISNTIPFVQLQMGALTNPTIATNLLNTAHVTYGWGS